MGRLVLLVHDADMAFSWVVTSCEFWLSVAIIHIWLELKDGIDYKIGLCGLQC